MKRTVALMAMLALAACKKEETTNTVAATAPVAGTAAPTGQDWTSTFAASPEGGFVMGNPNAPIKLVEYGSLTCPHCAEFSEKATGPLKALVQQGKISWEYRNYVRDAIDTTATLIARCNGPATFFGMQEAMFANQADWFAKIQALPQATFECCAEPAARTAISQARRIDRDQGIRGAAWCSGRQERCLSC